MKRLLLPLIASLTLPAVASAESVYWLLAGGRYSGGPSSYTVPIGSLNDCEKAGQDFLNAPWEKVIDNHRRAYVCIKGYKP